MEESNKQETTFHEILKICHDYQSPQASVLLALYPRIRYLTDNHSSLLENLPISKLFYLIRPFLANKDQEIRTTALRIYRYLSISSENFSILKQVRIEHFLIRSFEIEGKNQERIEACKLIRRWLEISPHNFPKSLCNSLVALGEVETDDFKEFGVEALRLLSISNSLLIGWSGGIKILINSLLDIKCSQELSENIIFTICFLLNEPKTRSFLKGGKELLRIMSIFTDTSPSVKENDLEVTLKLSRRALVLISRSWSGLIFLATRGLSSIISALNQPYKSLIKESILDTIQEMISIPFEASAVSYNLLNNYLAILIKALLHCGLYPVLANLSLDDNTRISLRSRKLLRLITQISSELLPDALPFPLSFINNPTSKAAQVVADIDSSARINLDVKDNNVLTAASEFAALENTNFLKPPKVLLNIIFKQHLVNTVDDPQFFHLLAKSGVSKENHKWDWQIIHQIVSGMIYNPQRLLNVNTNKFLKNLILFFTPAKGGFTSLPWKSHNFLIAKTGSTLISLLLDQKEVREMLISSFSESFFVVRKSFVEELMTCIDSEIVLEESKKSVKNRFLTEETVKFTMIREYFKWISLLVNHRFGRKVLKSTNFQMNFMKISNIEHLAPILLPLLDYKEQVNQQFLCCCVQSSHKLTKHKSVSQIQSLYRAGIFDLSWAIWSLVNLLYLTDQDIVSFALIVLNEICQYKENLKVLIQARPQNLLKHGDEGNKCLLKFLSSTLGFEYLNEMGYIDQQIELWHSQKNIVYAREIEEKIENGLSAAKKTYGLVLSTPKSFQNYESLQISWMLNLPFFIKACLPSGTFVIETSIEVNLEDAFVVGYLNSNVIDAKDIVSVCLMLGDSFIDCKGNEVSEPIWIKSRKDLKENTKFSNFMIFENEGVQFWFLEHLGTLKLECVKYRVQILPKGISSMQISQHFFGELVKTKLGLNKLREKGYLVNYVQSLSEKHSILEKRAWLWALGQIGSSNIGAECLIKLNAIQKITEIAENSEILSLRGTAIQTLSLISRSFIGKCELNRQNWTSSESRNSSIAIPHDLNKIFWLENSENELPYSKHCEEIEAILESIKLNETELNIYTHICVLGSVVEKNSSENFLRNLRINSPLSYQSLPLFHSIMVTLSAFTFKLPVRRVIHKLFERINRIENFDELDTFTFPS